MRNITRNQYDNYLARQASLNNVSNAAAQFQIDPTIEQKVTDRVQESSDFLTRINMVSVNELKGQKLAIGASGTIAGTNDVNAADVKTVSPIDMKGQMYECEIIDFATHVFYSTLDAWAKFPDFQQRMSNVTFKQQQRDLIMIGFNGTSRAAVSDRATNTLLQDVGIGWIQEAKTHAAASCTKDLTIGSVTGASYKNIDALVYSMVDKQIADHNQEDTGLVAICGRDILSDKYLGLIADNSLPTEKLATDIIIASKQVGGLPAIRVPFFPAKTVMVTTLDNLSIYIQEGSRRRQIEDNPRRKRIEDYQSASYDFVVEDFEKIAISENITEKV